MNRMPDYGTPEFDAVVDELRARLDGTKKKTKRQTGTTSLEDELRRNWDAHVSTAPPEKTTGEQLKDRGKDVLAEQGVTIHDWPEPVMMSATPSPQAETGLFGLPLPQKKDPIISMGEFVQSMHAPTTPDQARLQQASLTAPMGQLDDPAVTQQPSPVMEDAGLVTAARKIAKDFAPSFMQDWIGDTEGDGKPFGILNPMELGEVPKQGNTHPISLLNEQFFLKGALMGYGDEVRDTIAAAYASALSPDLDFHDALKQARAMTWRDDQAQQQKYGEKVTHGLELLGGGASAYALGETKLGKELLDAIRHAETRREAAALAGIVGATGAAIEGYGTHYGSHAERLSAAEDNWLLGLGLGAVAEGILGGL